MKTTTQNTIVYASSGAISGVVTKTVVAPLERIKLLYQVQNYYGTNNYISLNQSYKKIINESGYKGLFYGNFSNILRILPAYSLKFMFNDLYKSIFNCNVSNITFFPLLGVGMLAGLSQATITYPLDTIRTRMSIDKSMGRHTSIYNSLKASKLSTLYQGYTITFLSTPLYVGLQMSLYETFKKNISHTPNTLELMLAGASAGLIAQTTAYWGDTIKKQMQTNGINGKKKYKNIIDCVHKIYVSGGLKGFYPGITINSIKCIPEAALQFTIYDMCKNSLLSL
jgi:solute carrier family 25 phosphate transporter 23/24/25/41